MLDFSVLPPEVNSGLMYSGPGSGPMVTAASAWAGLAGELHSTAAAYESVILALTDGSWLGPAAAAPVLGNPPWLTDVDSFLAALGLTGNVFNSNGDGIVVGGAFGDILEGLTGSQTLDGSTPFDTFIKLISPFRLSTTATKDIEGLAEAASKSFGGATKASAVEAIPAALPPSLPSGISGGAALGGLGRAEMVGRLSVPPGWGGVAPSVSPAVTSVGNLGTPVSSQPLTAQPVANGMGGVPIVGGNGGRGMQFAAPRYGFEPTVVPRPSIGG